MTSLRAATELVRLAQARTRKPLAVVLAGHNGSGKSTLWYRLLADRLRIPLVNADRLMLSILPEPGPDGHLTPWAATLRDTDRGWMAVAQQGVQAFVAQAMGAKVPFAMETVFSHWQPRPDGTTASKIDLIRDMQRAGYFVLLIFVGLESADLSILRVQTRVAAGGHGVDEPTLRRRFPRTQRAIAEALRVADAAILTDNSRAPRQAFTVCRIQLGAAGLYDIRDAGTPPPAIAAWLPLISPA
ncbi:toxin [Muricoccus aerilatus]|uniref:toxin n=1 Tax=Muricoccus aerilatus TaxID=452982 RepID=UPI0005C1E5D2|nr:toxin [Roseomonas aerilata]